MHRARRHPLHSFHFWFLILSVFAATAAWKLGLLPGSGTEPVDPNAMAELAVPVPAHDPLALSLGDPSLEPLTSDDFLLTQSEPDAAEPDWSRTTASTIAEEPQPLPPAPFATEPTAAAATAAASQESPFGPAHPEFQAAPTESFVETPATAGPSSQPDLREMTPFQTASRNDVAAPRTPAEAPASSEGEGAVVTASATAPASTASAMNVKHAVAAPPLAELADIDQLLVDGQDVEAHRRLSMIYWQQPERRDEIVDRLRQTARHIYLQPQPHYMEPHEVQPAEVLENIAKQYNVSWQYLAKLNRIDPQRLRAGQKLKVVRGPFAAVVDLSDHELTVHAHGYFIAQFPVGIGQDGSTPIGKRTVRERLVDPTYYGPEGVIAAEDPANPLGEYWLDLGDSYGIHGTIDPESIGQDESKGCIRMRNEDVAEVFDLLTVGSEVVIRR